MKSFYVALEVQCVDHDATDKEVVDLLIRFMRTTISPRFPGGSIHDVRSEVWDDAAPGVVSIEHDKGRTLN